MAIILLILLSSAICLIGAINWNDEGQVKWAWGCAIDGHDIGKMKGGGEICGPACLARNDCKAFTWTSFEEGTCWFKNGGDPHDAKDATCGIIVESAAINWHDEGRVKWALGCDIDGHDVASIKGGGEICGSACLARSDCIAFSWTSYEGGTCWFKNGGSPRGARATTCGVITDRNSNGDISWHDEGRIKWAWGCDIDGHDIGSTKGGGETCGSACLTRSGCRAFTWTSYEGGTCWLKNGGDPRYTSDTTCGKVVSPGIVHVQPVAPEGDCVVERVPQNGWIENAQGKKLAIGEIVDQFTTININCSANNLVEGSTQRLCYQGKWSSPIQDCQPRCSSRYISGITIVATTCLLNNVEVHCSDPAKPGTQAHVYCRERYERSRGTKQITICGDDGSWKPVPETCTPICGEPTATGTPYVVGGFQASINEVPWHVIIYKFNGRGFTLQCGGSIINERIIVSAMHCFWNPQEAGKFDASMFQVAAGKERLKYDAIETQKDQKFEVELFLNDPGYSHATSNYAADIALVVLKTSIEFRSYIAPICFPYGLKHDETIVPAGWKGRVAGFGKIASGGPPSEFLKTIELPVIDKAQCLAESEREFRPNITPDKFCAGYLNSNVGVCQGDSGGGLVFNKTVNDRVKWYLRGIVSVGANKLGSCDTDKYTTFTNVAYYEKLLETYEPMYRPQR